MSYRIQQVRTKADFQRFLDVPDRIYAGNPTYVRPLDLDIRSTFDPQKNSFFSHGEATQFLLTDEKGDAGRVAVFINHKKAHTFEVPTGGIGFFEVVEDPEAARLLFNTAREWLEERGMEAMDGPINFGENHVNWGLLVEGFDQPPTYGMHYNPPYYRTFFEDFGFNSYFEQVTSVMDLQKPLPQRFHRIRDWAAQRRNIQVEYPTKKNIHEFGEYFRICYNEGWQFHENFTPMTKEQVRLMVEELKLALIEEMLIFAFVNNEPAGFILNLPDLNQIIKSYNGSLSIQDGLKFMWRKRNKFAYYRKRNILTRGRLIIMGVRPKFQKLGIESVLAYDGYHSIRSLGITHMELGWVGDYNPKMLSILNSTGATHVKTHQTYRFHFDPERRKQAERSAIIPMGTPKEPTTSQAL